MASAVVEVDLPRDVTLPVRLTVGTVSAEIGTITLDTDDDVRTVLPALLRQAADEMERDA